MHLALFDFDHTLTTADCYSAFIYRYLNVSKPSLKLLGLGLKKQLYKLGCYSATHLRQQVSYHAFKGQIVAEVEADARRFVQSFVQQHLNQSTMQTLAWHQQQGHQVVVVSASLDVYLKPWCQGLTVDLLCTQLEVDKQHYTGRYLGADCCAQAKADRVQQAYDLSHYQKIVAYGDSHEDAAMLALADEAYLRGQRIA